MRVATIAVGARRLPLLADRPEIVPAVATAVSWVFLVGAGGGHGGGGHLAHGAEIPAMALATMGLFAVPLVRTVASASPWWRAQRAVAIAFASFVGTWAVVALGMHVAVELLTVVVLPTDVLAAAAAAGGAALVFRPGRAREVVRCGKPVAIRGHGRPADADCARAGLVAALWCARLCAPGMVAMLAAPDRLWLMAALTAVALGERVWAPRGRVAVAAGYAVVSVAALL
jgi:hypothetical protein